MTTFRAKENNPLFKKLQRVFEVMEEEGISISLVAGSSVKLVEGEHEYMIMDLEGTSFNNECVFDFPPGCEWKLTRHVFQ